MSRHVLRPASVWTTATWYYPLRSTIGSLDGTQYHQMPIEAKEKAHGVDGLAGVPRHWFQRWRWSLDCHGGCQGGFLSA